MFGGEDLNNLGVAATVAAAELMPVDYEDVVPEIEGIVMVTGTEHGFFGPTNLTNAPGATRYNFFTGNGDKISRPEFGLKNPPQGECPMWPRPAS